MVACEGVRRNCGRRNSLKCPTAGFANNFMRIVRAALKRESPPGNADFQARSPHCADSVPLRPPQGSVLEPRAEGVVAHIEQGDQIDWIGIRPRLKQRLWRVGSAAVPRTNLLANIAAKNPVAHAFPQWLWNGAAQLNGEIANAARRIEHTGRGECLGGTGIEASRATTAIVGGGGLVVNERNIREQCG